MSTMTQDVSLLKELYLYSLMIQRMSWLQGFFSRFLSLSPPHFAALAFLYTAIIWNGSEVVSIVVSLQHS